MVVVVVVVDICILFNIVQAKKKVVILLGLGCLYVKYFLSVFLVLTLFSLNLLCGNQAID